MSDASFASLGPTLLARKGGAKPAMRPQLAPLPEMVADEQLEDLGWNDMGQDDPAANENGADIVELNPAAAQVTDKDGPLVKRQQRDLATRLLREDAEAEAPTPKPVAKTQKKRTKTAAKRRAAFTLRLDPDRHLKLRLAATMQGVSAQALVTDALDAMFDGIDDLDALAARMKRT